LISFTILYFSCEIFFNYSLNDENIKVEKSIIDSNIKKIIHKIEISDKLNKNLLENILIFKDKLDNSFIKIEDITNQKILYMSPDMPNFIEILKKNNNNKEIYPEKEVVFKKIGSNIFYYLEKTIIINNRKINIQIFDEETTKINRQIKNRDKAFFLLLLAFIIIFTFSLIILKFTLKPIEQFAKEIDDINSNNLNKKIKVQWIPKELLIIKKKFNIILSRLYDSFQKINQFSEDVSHELRTPLHSLKVEIEVALQKERTNNEYKETLISSLEECNKIYELIDNLTFLAKTEKKDIQINPEPFSISKEIFYLVKLFEPIAEEKNIEIKVILENSFIVYLDKVIFMRIISNLISNAINYNKLNGKIDIIITKLKYDLNVKIRDTGIGIKEKNLPYIFDRMYRVNNLNIKRNNNLGLGLSMVKNLIELQKGTITIQSEFEKGTTVTLNFPNCIQSI